MKGRKKQTGIILTTNKNDKNLTIPRVASSNLGAFSYKQLEKLHSKKDSIKVDNIDKTIELELIGNMQDYVWQVNDQTWPDVSPIELEYGKTYLFKIRNDTSMSHPINIH
ncbi:hypothetical protein AS144_01395 [Francisella endosymbiont of Amblyomma maculatum]|nr:hypothetical protein AS144_01395 [Francisella endosymbiont of Amblyomma maculatum]